MKRIACFLVFASLGLSGFAQSNGLNSNNPTFNELEIKEQSNYIPVFQFWKEHDIFQHLDVSLTAGSTGIGLDVSSPIGEYVQIRAGYEYMPRFTKIMKFDMTINGQPARSYDEDGNRQETKFDKLKEFLYGFTGYDVEDHADMIGNPTINNFKLLVDVSPFKEHHILRNFHFTAGFYLGPSKFAEAVNTTETMVSLVSAGLYNNIYTKAINGESLIDFSSFSSLQGVSIELPEQVRQKFVDFGKLGFAVGYYARDMVDSKGVEHKAGERYIVEPNENSMVVVEAKSNSFKPYVGFGYGGRLMKKRDDWKLSFDCGVMFWGGTPDLYVHDGMNLTKDVENITGQVGTYVDLLKAFKVYPVLSFRLTKRIF